MTNRVHDRRRNQSTAARLLVLTALAAVAVLAPEALKHGVTSITQDLASIALAAGELFEQLFLQPLVEGLQQSISDTGTAPTPPGDNPR